MKGWIKLHRKLLDNPIFGSEKGLKIWIWCLLKASHKKTECVYIGRKKVCVDEGQFIFGSFKANEELKISVSTIWYWLNELEVGGYVVIKKTTKYSIITIKNWKEYQGVVNKTERSIETNGKQMVTYNNVKNVKNMPDGTKVKLPDGLIALKYFGQWVNAKDKSIKIDEKHYKELR